MLKKVRNKLRVRVGKERYNDIKRMDRTDRQRERERDDG